MLLVGMLGLSAFVHRSAAQTEYEVLASEFTTDDIEAMEDAKEVHAFEADTHRVMDILINSLYKAKEIFLREIISNASDALDKIRFLALQDPQEVLGDNRALEIRISFDADEKTLTIRDTGVGMTREDLINNLGTVAKSGTSSFVEALSDAGDADMGLIGQFGVGFYSVYLVADRVRVVSKNNNDEQYVWESQADSSFSVAEDPRGNTLGRGTEITLFLKEDAHEYLDQDRLSELIQRYSEFITFPIHLYKSHKEEVAVDEEEGSSAAGLKDTEDEADGVSASDEEEEPKMRTEQVDVWDWERINSNVAIWTRPKGEIEDEEYRKFYSVLSQKSLGDTEPITWIHFTAEGEVEFKSILYIPKDAPYDQYDDYHEKRASVRLYVRKVLITDEIEDFLPKYLNFMRGVVDSDDLPLNVSRETLQQHKILKVMGKKIVRKALEMIRKLSLQPAPEPEIDADEDEEPPEAPYLHFYRQFGKSLKMGVIEDGANRSKLAKLLRFKTTTGGDEMRSFEQYVEDMPAWQDAIYFVAAESQEAAEKSPFLEAFEKKGVEVLYFTEPVDEYMAQHLGEFDGKRLQNIAKEGVNLDDGDEAAKKRRERAYKEKFKPLVSYYKKNFSKKIKSAQVVTTLESAPCLVVTSQYGHSANMERLVRAQTFADPSKLQYLVSSRTLQLNPRHPIVVELLKRVEEDDNDSELYDMASLMLDTSLVQSGFVHDDVDNFAATMYRQLASSLSVAGKELENETAIDGDVEEEEEDLDAEDYDDSGFGMDGEL